ncbi:MAG: 2,3-bisphosphoglycerate-independent phosphoglycerate mutase [Clostridia bacterium]
MKKLTALVIMDGYGLSKSKVGNAVGCSCSSFVNYLLNTYPNTALEASGEYVGLPAGQMGNSEVGHLNMGAGRIVYQDLLKISNSIKDRTFFKNEVLLSAFDSAKGHSLHLMGLVSNGGVHSHISHIFALLQMAKEAGVTDCYVHCFTDGRDTSPTSAINFVADLQQEMDRLQFGKIATVCGRYYAMDRDNRWDRVEKAYNMLVLGQGLTFDNASQAVQSSYDNGIYDEFILPSVITSGGKPIATINNDDSVIFFNYRPDRAREMTRVFTQKGFDNFSIKGKERKVKYTIFTKYDETFNLPTAFGEQHLDNTLGEYISKLGLTQLRAAETEKYAHVTFFFNGGVEKANEGESRLLIPSPTVATYDLQPQMNAQTLTTRVIAELQKDKYDCLVLNYANCDMVGHTGNFEATCQAVKAVDDCVRQLIEYILSTNGRVLLTADHGNAEQMLLDGATFTAHTTNKVPFILIDQQFMDAKLHNGALCDIAPTLLDLMNLPIPQEMTGKSLIIK